MLEGKDVAIWECSEQITEQVVQCAGERLQSSRAALTDTIYAALLPLAPQLREGKTAQLDLGFAELEVSLNAFQ